MDFNLRGLAKKELVIPDKLDKASANDKHLSMLEVIKPYARDTKLVEKNLTPVYVDYQTRNTSIIWVLCPEWSPSFPPFNLARLSGVAKSAGYESEILDINIEAYRSYMDTFRHDLSYPLWSPTSSWRWTGDSYWNDIHPHLESILQKKVDYILEKSPNIVGFTLYYINDKPSVWMMERIREKNPDIKFAVGGSNVQKGFFKTLPIYDYVVAGEGEAAILDILDDIENNKLRASTVFHVGKLNQRLNINGMPMPDYESIDFTLYDIPNGVNTEFSRGCTAKCSFCEETHFWKYRQRTAVDVLTEVEWLYYNKGTTVFWFIDSLVNGNPAELRAFCKAIDAKGLDIHWTGYARCDHRMDLDYFHDLKAGGCIMLNYGIESGSQNVLNDMHKGVTIEAMEMNLKNCKEVGIFAATNWIVGFPTETLQDFANSMTFLWRNRNYNINNIAAGVGFAQGPETLTGQNPERFNLSPFKYMGFWITKDLSMGGMHVMHRVKFFSMFIDMMVGCTDMPFQYPVRRDLIDYHYTLEWLQEGIDDKPFMKEIDEYEEFDYNIIDLGENQYADTLVNEIWPLLRLMWLSRGAFRITILFTPELDLEEFGTQFGPEQFSATYKFEINELGKWKADFEYEFNQVPNYLTHKPEAFITQDYSRLQSNAAKSARKLAKPKWSIEDGRDSEDIRALIKEEKVLNDLDFSFKYRYKGRGKW